MAFGRFTTEEEIDFTAKLLKERVEILRELSPLYEFAMDKENGGDIEWTGGKGQTQSIN